MLLVVAESQGSSPGRSGYKMAVAANGELVGSIGGGVMEVNLVERSRALSSEPGGTATAYPAATLIEEVHQKTSQNPSGGVNDAPGYREHHSGRAIDVTTPGCAPAEEAFEDTDAFAWLQRNAARHGFRLSYPRGNPHGVVYEPWHWYHVGVDGTPRA